MARHGRPPARPLRRTPRRGHRSLYDQLAKGLADEVLSKVGGVDKQVEVAAGVQWLDLWHEPDPRRARVRGRLGLIGEMTAEPCQLEPFARTPGLLQIRACVRKQLHWHHDRERRARRHLPLARLCITSPGRPRTALRELGFKAIRPGVYRSVPGLRIYVLVLSEVPKNRETLLARLLGSGRILTDAITELLALPDDAWENGLAIPWLARLGFKHPGLGAKEEVVMTEVREWFEKYKQGLVRKGEKKGEKKGRREALAQLCALRLGRPLSPEEVAALADQLKQIGETRVGEMLLNASPDALAAWLSEPQAA